MSYVQQANKHYSLSHDESIVLDDSLIHHMKYYIDFFILNF